MSTSQPPVKRRRTTQACSICRKAKLRCSGTYPKCSRCDSLNLACEYARTPGLPSDAGLIGTLESQLARLDSLEAAYEQLDKLFLAKFGQAYVRHRASLAQSHAHSNNTSAVSSPPPKSPSTRSSTSLLQDRNSQSPYLPPVPAPSSIRSQTAFVDTRRLSAPSLAVYDKAPLQRQNQLETFPSVLSSNYDPPHQHSRPPYQPFLPPLSSMHHTSMTLASPLPEYRPATSPASQMPTYHTTALHEPQMSYTFLNHQPLELYKSPDPRMTTVPWTNANDSNFVYQKYRPHP